MLQRRHHTQALRIVVEAAMSLEAVIQRALTGMAEGRMAEIVRQCQSLGQVFVEAKLPRQCASDLGHFQRVGQPGAVMIALVKDENLGLVLEATKSRRMDHPVAIAPKCAACCAWWLRETAATAMIGVAGIGLAGGSHSDRHGDLYLFQSGIV